MGVCAGDGVKGVGDVVMDEGEGVMCDGDKMKVRG